MCFEFGSCFGGGRTDDYGGERPNRKEEHGRGRRGRDRTWNHVSHHNGGPADHKPLPHAAVDEAGHKAYHDGARKADHVDVGAGGYAVYPQLEAGIEAPKVPAWHNKVGDDAYTGRLQVQEPAAMDYHHYYRSRQGRY
ncbi:uncharacterized protein LOC123439282 [Hordeum vulgare subsp. vulgare]|uniref:uncharacterized protein LOC123439282 n=1 Tax=Hordeum vulgare subsp. vulgare TaxID=112509 RepID=UPI001D1A59A3|nr:uncharacterized protein LOC123439282 [Hordeum vulgare subsp. vulgare]KAI5004469.1 hypothetical protein ZWY2020_031712 [Hordeum vulgare]